MLLLDEVRSIEDAWTEEYQVIRAINGTPPDSSRPAPITKCPRADWQSPPFDSLVNPGVYFVQVGRISRPMRIKCRDSAPKLSSASMPCHSGRALLIGLEPPRPGGKPVAIIGPSRHAHTSSTSTAAEQSISHRARG